MYVEHLIGKKQAKMISSIIEKERILLKKIQREIQEATNKRNTGADYISDFQLLS